MRGSDLSPNATLVIGGSVSGTSIEKRESEGHDSHGEVETASHGSIVSYNPDAPSEEWGWHGHWSDFAPRGKRMFLWFGVFVLLAMAIFGNHVSHVEDYFLGIIALLMAGWIVRSERAHKRARRLRP